MAGRGNVFVILSALLIFSGLVSVNWPRISHGAGPHVTSTSSHKQKYHAPKTNIFADLQDSEVIQLLKFLHDQENALNLTKSENATPWHNYVFAVEALPPPKSQALEFLDGSADAPLRYARVVVSQGTYETAFYCEYRVGPLPISRHTTISPLEYAHVEGRHCISNPLPDYLALTSWLALQAVSFGDIMKDLLGEALSYDGGLLSNVMASARMLRVEKGSTMMWTSIHSRADAWSVLPQGLYIQLNVSTRNPANWAVLKWFYNGKLYDSTAGFRAAWERGDFVKSKPNFKDWAEIDDAELTEPGTEMAPPVMIQPGGKRYRIDPKEQFVSWMGFEFYITSRYANAMSLYDIRFRGERIMYELGLQEALAHYAGDNPMQSGQLWLDTFYGMGLLMLELVPGYDCPAYATYLETSFSHREKTWKNPNSICVFEYTADHPLQRHTTNNYVSISRNTYLIIRSVSTVGNYDYTIEYIFYLDGTIEVKVRASGYIFSAFYDAPAGPDQGPDGEDEYGYRVHDVVSGSLHDHVINFKADIDIDGTANSLHRLDIVPHSQSYAWDSPFETPRQTMHLHTTPIPTEVGLNWAPNSASTYLIVNNASRNAWGEKRAYRMVPGTGMGTPPHLTVLNSTSLERASLWAEKDFWVVKRKEEERRSAHEMNVLEPAAPIVDFGELVDGEGILQEDLVIYFNLGAHHIPHAGDIPNTLEHTSASSVMFIPHNFHSRDPSRLTAQGVKIKLDSKTGDKSFKYYGGKYTDDVCLTKTDLEPDLELYKGLPHGFSVATTDLSGNLSFIGMGVLP